jgi:hypothetical protein
MKSWRFVAQFACSLTLGCGDSQPGDLTVLLEPESVITDGLPAGEGPGEVADGWSISFSRYLTSVGPVELHALGTIVATDDKRIAVDLTKIPRQGEELFQLRGLEAGRYDFFYELTAEITETHPDADDVQVQEMQSQEANFSIHGLMTKSDGTSCPPRRLSTPPDGLTPEGEGPLGDPCYSAPEVEFELLVSAETHFGPCEIDGTPGVSIKAGDTRTAAISIHGDHLFFNGFPEAGEGGVTRLAQWLADCDLNLDGLVTEEELAAIEPGDLGEFDERFKLGGSPLVPLDSMLTYVRAQLKTQGHFQGEGECAFDGTDHEDHED